MSSLVMGYFNQRVDIGLGKVQASGQARGRTDSKLFSRLCRKHAHTAANYCLVTLAWIQAIDPRRSYCSQRYSSFGSRNLTGQTSRRTVRQVVQTGIAYLENGEVLVAQSDVQNEAFGLMQIILHKTAEPA
jgi:hypothetical protein